MKNLLPQNLKTLREAKGYTQTEAASLLGLKRPTYINYEKGGNEPGIETILSIAQHYGVTIDCLLSENLPAGNLNPKNKRQVLEQKGNLNGNLTGNLIPEKAPVSEKTERLKELRLIEANTKAEFGKVSGFNVYDLDGKAAAGRAIALLEEDKVKAAPTVALPELGPGLHIRITAEGDSMFPTVKPGDKPVGTWVSGGYSKMREGAVHLVIDVDDTMAVKRLYFGAENTLSLVSDNELYPPQTRHLSEFRAIFEVKLVCSSDMSPNLVNVRRDIRVLQTQMEEMQAFLRQK